MNTNHLDEKNTPLVSVITTVKNGSEFIRSFIETVSNQSYENIECIIINDNSTDDSKDKLSSFISKENVTLYDAEIAGRGYSLNQGISLAKGDYIAILDIDDCWHPQKVELQIEYMLKSDCDILCTETSVFTEDSDIVFTKKNDKPIVSKITFQNQLTVNNISHSSVLMKNIFNYDVSRISQFDAELWFRALTSKHRISKMNTVLCYHRVHENQSFESKKQYLYSYRAFKLKLYYVSYHRKFIYLPLIVGKFVYGLIFSKKVRKILRTLFKIQ